MAVIATSVRRSRTRSTRPPIAASTRTALASGTLSHGQTNVRRSVNAASRGLGLRYSISTPAKSSPAWLPSAARYAWRPPLATSSGTPQARAPAANAIDDPSSAPATPRPMRSASTSSSSGAVIHSVCDRKPTEKPARSAPRTIARPDAAMTAGSSRRSPSGPGRCRHHARLRQTSAAIAAARPGTSLIGREVMYQVSGVVAASRVASSARRDSAGRPRRSPPSRASALSARGVHHRSSTAPTSETAASARASTRSARPSGHSAAVAAVAALPTAM